MADIVGIALEAIARYGLVAIFILLVLDGALLLPVFPGELVLIMAVAAYARDTGDLLFLVALTTAAGLLGSLILYSVTRGGGRRLVERFPRFFMMPRRRRERLERVFQRPVGQSLVLWLRLIPFTRILVNIPAGLARMPLVRFLVLSTIGLATYHAGFLWFTFEVNRPGSALAAQQQQLQDAYASPAWDFVQANAIITGTALVLLGIVLSVRASVRMYRDPEEHVGSLLGSLATLLLFWGGIALAVVTYLDPGFVFVMGRIGGVDLPGLAAALGVGNAELLLGIAVTGIILGLLLARLRRQAMRRHKQHRAGARGDALSTPRTFELLVPPAWWHEQAVPADGRGGRRPQGEDPARPTDRGAFPGRHEMQGHDGRHHADRRPGAGLGDSQGTVPARGAGRRSAGHAPEPRGPDEAPVHFRRVGRVPPDGPARAPDVAFEVRDGASDLPPAHTTGDASAATDADDDVGMGDRGRPDAEGTEGADDDGRRRGDGKGRSTGRDDVGDEA